MSESTTVGSEALIALYAALAKAHGEVRGAVKDDLNPHYKHKYATLDSVTDAIRPVFAKHGLSIMSWPVMAVGASGHQWGLQSMLFHSAGASLDCGVYPLHFAKVDAHSFAGAVTYARRQSEMAIANIAQTDDDGNTAMGIDGNSVSGAAETPKAQADPRDFTPAEPLDEGQAMKDIQGALTMEMLVQAWEPIGKIIKKLPANTQEAFRAAKETKKQELSKGAADVQ